MNPANIAPLDGMVPNTYPRRDVTPLRNSMGNNGGYGGSRYMDYIFFECAICKDIVINQYKCNHSVDSQHTYDVSAPTIHCWRQIYPMWCHCNLCQSILSYFRQHGIDINQNKQIFECAICKDIVINQYKWKYSVDSQHTYVVSAPTTYLHCWKKTYLMWCHCNSCNSIRNYHNTELNAASQYNIAGTSSSAEHASQISHRNISNT